jgi:hypothetical protein
MKFLHFFCVSCHDSKSDAEQDDVFRLLSCLMTDTVSSGEPRFISFNHRPHDFRTQILKDFSGCELCIQSNKAIPKVALNSS